MPFTSNHRRTISCSRFKLLWQKKRNRQLSLKEWEISYTIYILYIHTYILYTHVSYRNTYLHTCHVYIQWYTHIHTYIHTCYYKLQMRIIIWTWPGIGAGLHNLSGRYNQPPGSTPAHDHPVQDRTAKRYGCVIHTYIQLRYSESIKYSIIRCGVCNGVRGSGLREK